MGYYDNDYTGYSPNTIICGCIGPQNGQPLCPCMMRNVYVRNGRYIREDDLGPVQPFVDWKDFMEDKDVNVDEKIKKLEDEVKKLKKQIEEDIVTGKQLLQESGYVYR